MANPEARPDVQVLLANAGWLAPLVRGLLKDAHEAEDVLQETWLQVLRSPPDMAEVGSVRAWLARVARRIALRRIERNHSRRWRETAVAAPEAAVDPEDLSERVRLQRELAAYVLELPEAYRVAITLRYLEGMSTRELAARLGIADEAARKRVSRGLELLRARLDQAHDGKRDAWKTSLALLALPRSRCLPPSNVVRHGLALRSAALLLVAGAATLWIWRARVPPESRGPGTGSFALTFPAAASGAEFGLVPARESRRLLPAQDELPSSASDALAGARARGRVLDPAGEPVPGALVEARLPDRSASDPALERPAERVLAATRTDEHGEFRLDFAQDVLFDLCIDAQPLARALLPDRRAGLDEEVRLAPAARLEVELESADHEPLAGARFRLLALWIPAGVERELARGHSDAEGRIVLERLAPGRYQLDVVGDAQADVSAVLELVAGATLVRHYRPELARRVRGRVVAAESGQPLPEAEVVAVPGAVDEDLSPDRLGRGSCARPPVRCGPDGSFELLVSPSYLAPELRIRAPGFAPASLAVVLDGEPVTLGLAPGGRARGRVLVRPDEPASGAHVTAVVVRGADVPDWNECRATADGAFELLDLQRDVAHVLRIRQAGLGTLFVALPPLAPERERDLGALVLAPAARVEGRVRDEQGRALPGARVTLRLTAVAGLDVAAELASQLACTDREGRFAFDELAAGDYRLQAECRGRVSPPSEFALEPGACERDVELTYSAARTISGTVVDSSGRPLLNACVVVDALGRAGEPRLCVTDSAGRFELEPAGEGPFGLRAVPNSIHLEGGDVQVHALDVLGLEAGTRDLCLVLPPAELVTGWLLSPADEPLADVLVFAREAGGGLLTYEYTDPEGRFHLRLPPGASADLSILGPDEIERVLARSVPAGALDLELVRTDE